MFLQKLVQVLRQKSIHTASQKAPYLTFGIMVWQNCCICFMPDIMGRVSFKNFWLVLSIEHVAKRVGDHPSAFFKQCFRGNRRKKLTTTYKVLKYFWALLSMNAGFQSMYKGYEEKLKMRNLFNFSKRRLLIGNPSNEIKSLNVNYRRFMVSSDSRTWM